jgi:hypothetical protein
MGLPPLSAVFFITAILEECGCLGEISEVYCPFGDEV